MVGRMLLLPRVCFSACAFSDITAIVYMLAIYNVLSNGVLKLFYLTGASLNICKRLCNALPVF